MTGGREGEHNERFNIALLPLQFHGLGKEGERGAGDSPLAAVALLVCMADGRDGESA